MEDGQIQCRSESCFKTPESFFGSARLKEAEVSQKTGHQDLVTRWGTAEPNSCCEMKY